MYNLRFLTREQHAWWKVFAYHHAPALDADQTPVSRVALAPYYFMKIPLYVDIGLQNSPWRRTICHMTLRCMISASTHFSHEVRRYHPWVEVVCRLPVDLCDIVSALLDYDAYLKLLVDMGM